MNMNMKKTQLNQQRLYWSTLSTNIMVMADGGVALADKCL